MDLNAFPSPLPLEEIREDHDHQHHPNFGGSSSSSSSVSCHFVFNSTQEQARYYHQQFYNPQEDEDHYTFHGGLSSYEIKNKFESIGLKSTPWRKEDHDTGKTEQNNYNNNTNNPMKWMSSKMRVMQKVNNNPDRVSTNKINESTPAATTKMQLSTSSMETEISSSNSYNRNSPIRVCADCNTTKTPLWRSGPKGPKSLCNACGIRQRKAKRAMAAAAAAAAAANGAMIPTDQPMALKIKVQPKDKKGKNENASNHKKRMKTTAAHVSTGSPSNEQKKLGFEDFLINLSKNLGFHRVFPEDERDAAILLMALSSGLVHG